MGYQDFSGKTVSDALTNASVALGITSDHLTYEVIDKGSTGLFGIGSKNAVIRVRTQEEETPDDSREEEKLPETDTADNDSVDVNTAQDDVKANATEDAPQKLDDETVAAQASDDANEAAEAGAPKAEKNRKHAALQADPDTCITIVTDFLKDMFEAMQMDVEIDCSYNEEEGSVDVDLSGPEMGVIIGKRGQTLDSVQYLANLALNRKVDTYTRVKLDTEDYRARRKATLENLARNVAFRVRKTHKAASLEPMNPYERRIIHAALQNDRYVTTHSEGEEPYRHVVITLKPREKRDRNYQD